jgi:hypothetical protein
MVEIQQHLDLLLLVVVLVDLGLMDIAVVLEAVVLV